MHHPRTSLLALLARVAQRRGGGEGSAPTPFSSSSPFSSARAALATSCSARGPAAGSAAPAAPPEPASASTSASREPPSPSSDDAEQQQRWRSAEARAALRALLRSVDAHFTSVAGNRQWRDFVLEQARRARDGGSDASASSLAAAARDYTSLVDNVARHRQLLRDYNLGLDPDERNRRMVEKTARRVGFSIPKAKDEDEEEEDQERAGGASIARRAAAARAAAAAAGGNGGQSKPAGRGR